MIEEKAARIEAESSTIITRSGALPVAAPEGLVAEGATRAAGIVNS
ncbi:hypothetical protein [Phaeovulum sp. W22_SRMD_FR3]